MGGNINFEEYRQPWETGPHWELKREFLERYQDHFTIDRLLCLAQAYSNIELLHCSYPIEVMKQVRELSQPLQGCRRFRGISSAVQQRNESQKGKRSLSDFETPKKNKFIKFCSPSMDIEKSNTTSTTGSESSIDATIVQSTQLKTNQNYEDEVKKSLPVKEEKHIELIQEQFCDRNVEMKTENSKNHDKDFIGTKKSEFFQKECSPVTQKHMGANVKYLKNFAEELKTSKKKSKLSPLGLINETGNRLKVSEFLNFDIVVDYSSPVHNRKYVCNFSIKDIPISQGVGTSKKRAKNQAADLGYDYLLKLLEPNKNVCSSESDSPKTNSAEHSTDVPLSTSMTNLCDNKQFGHVTPTTLATEILSVNYFPVNKALIDNSLRKQFLLIDASAVEKHNQQTPGAMLNFSAQFCRKQYSYNIERIPTTDTYLAEIILDKTIIASAVGPTKVAAKQTAAKSALENLRKEVYTIKIKTSDEDGLVITRQSMLDSTNPVSQAVSEDNKGYKMLKMMGWAGGGIGKTEGIIEPIMASDSSCGKGLGYLDENGKLNKTKFAHKINALLVEYSLSKEMQPLIFSSDFDKAERKEIHKLARKYSNLISNSYGKDEARQLFIKRKLSVTELLDYLLQCGGSTQKYELVDLSMQ